MNAAPVIAALDRLEAAMRRDAPEATIARLRAQYEQAESAYLRRVDAFVRLAGRHFTARPAAPDTQEQT